MTPLESELRLKALESRLVDVERPRGAKGLGVIPFVSGPFVGIRSMTVATFGLAANQLGMVPLAVPARVLATGLVVVSGLTAGGSVGTCLYRVRWSPAASGFRTFKRVTGTEGVVNFSTANRRYVVTWPRAVTLDPRRNLYFLGIQASADTVTLAATGAVVGLAGWIQPGTNADFQTFPLSTETGDSVAQALTRAPVGAILTSAVWVDGRGLSDFVDGAATGGVDGASNDAFVDLQTAQTAAGAKTWTNDGRFNSRVLLGARGTAGAPEVALVEADATTDTGIFFPNDDSLAVTVDGVEQARFLNEAGARVVETNGTTTLRPAAVTSGQGATLNVRSGGSTGGAGGDLRFTGGDGSTGGGMLRFRAGRSTAGNTNGGSAQIDGGAPTGTGVKGLVQLGTQGGIDPELGTSGIELGNTTDNSTVTKFGSGATVWSGAETHNGAITNASTLAQQGLLTASATPRSIDATNEVRSGSHDCIGNMVVGGTFDQRTAGPLDIGGTIATNLRLSRTGQETTVRGACRVNANLQVDTDLAVLGGDVTGPTVADDLRVDAGNAARNVVVGGTTANGVDLGRAGRATTVKGTATVTEATTLQSTLAVTGTSTLTGRSTHNGGTILANGQTHQLGVAAGQSAPVTVWFLNKSGGALVAKDLVVVFAGATDYAVTTSTTLGDPAVAGVVVTGGADGVAVEVAVVGVVLVACAATTGGVVRGARLRQSITAARATSGAVSVAEVFGKALTALAADTPGDVGVLLGWA